MATPRIFVSHSKANNEFGIALAKDLRRVLEDKSAVWYDDTKQGLNPGDPWFQRIENEITARDTFIIILSPDAMNSRWVRREYDIALNENKRIIPIMYQDCQVWPSLKTIHQIFFQPPRIYEEALADLLTALGIPKSALRKQRRELAGTQVVANESARQAREQRVLKSETGVQFPDYTDFWKDLGDMVDTPEEPVAGARQIQIPQYQSPESPEPGTTVPASPQEPGFFSILREVAGEIVGDIFDAIGDFIGDVGGGALTFGAFDCLFISISLGLWQKNWWIFLGSLLCSVLLFLWGSYARYSFSSGISYLLIIVFTISWGFIAWLIASPLVGLFQAPIPYITVAINAQQLRITWGEVSAGAISLVAIIAGFNIHKFLFRY